MGFARAWGGGKTGEQENEICWWLAAAHHRAVVGTLFRDCVVFRGCMTVSRDNRQASPSFFFLSASVNRSID